MRIKMKTSEQLRPEKVVLILAVLILGILLGAWFSSFWNSLPSLVWPLLAITGVITVKWLLDRRRMSRLQRAIAKMRD